jgi:hypothetical protein
MMANNVEKHSRAPDLKDRLASALGSAVVMAITFVLLAIATAFFAVLSAGLHLIDGHGKSQFEGTAHLVLFFDGFITTAFSAFIAFAALAGFALGSERMARLFGVFWQTESPTRGERWLVTTTIVALLGTMLVYAMRKLGIV